MKLLLLGAALLSATLLIGEDRKPFVGFEIGKAEGSFSYGSNEWDGDNQTTLGLKAGFQGKNDRMYVSYLDVDEYEDTIFTLPYSEKYRALLLNLEGVSDSYEITNGLSASLFLGAHVGAIRCEVELGTAEENETDVMYGLQGGALLNITNQFSLEVGYRHSWSNLSIEGVGLDNAKNYYAGLNYSF